MSHNKELDGLLTEVRKAADQADEEKDFGPVFNRLRDFRDRIGPIKYDNTAKWYAIAACLAAGGAFAAAYFLVPELERGLDDWGYAVMGAFAVPVIVLLIVIGCANNAISEISELIFAKDIAFDNRLVEQDVEGRMSDLYERFREEFGEFRSRGDEGRRIVKVVKGAGDQPFEYYVFRYVRVYYVPVTRKVGKTTITTMERRTETLYRRGLIMDFPYSQGVAVTSGGGSYDYPAGFAPASPEFGKIFGVGAVDEMTAAKFLKPAVVLAFQELNGHFSGLNVEISRAGRLNIAFSDGDVLDLERRHSIAEPDEFEAEIKSKLELPKLRLLLDFAATLKKHNDSNF